MAQATSLRMIWDNVHASQGTASEIAQEYNDLVQALSSQLPLPDNSVSTKDDSVNEIKFRIYTPVEAVSKTALTVGVLAYSRGWIIGSLDSEDMICRVVVQQTPCIIVSINYRFGPDIKC